MYKTELCSERYFPLFFSRILYIGAKTDVPHFYVDGRINGWKNDLKIFF